MRILVIGDIHGLDTWEQIVKKEKYDVCVFLGDYFDSFDVDAAVQIANFKDIIAFKKETPNVFLLIGNHDLHYLISGERYSGYQLKSAAEIQKLLKKEKLHLRKAYEADGYLFTHAGVTQTWADTYKILPGYIANQINLLNDSVFRFNSKDESGCGESIHQGPMWVRPASLKKDPVANYKQIVGHTRMKRPDLDHKTVYFNDSLWNGYYLVIENGIVIIKNNL